MWKTSPQFFITHLGQRRIHHDDEADGDGDVGGADLKAVDEGRRGWDEVADGDADSHGEEDPEREIAVQEGEVLALLQGRRVRLVFEVWRPWIRASDLVDLFLHGELVQRGDRQGEEEADAAIEDDVRIAEGAGDLFGRAADGGRIGDAPVRGHRLARPVGARFVGGIVADGEDEVHLRGVGSGELIPGFAAQAVGRDPGGVESGREPRGAASRRGGCRRCRQ